MEENNLKEQIRLMRKSIINALYIDNPKIYDHSSRPLIKIMRPFEELCKRIYDINQSGCAGVGCYYPATLINEYMEAFRSKNLRDIDHPLINNSIMPKDFLYALLIDSYFIDDIHLTKEFNHLRVLFFESEVNREL